MHGPEPELPFPQAPGSGWPGAELVARLREVLRAGHVASARNRGPWKSIDDLEIVVAEYIDWFNHRRLHGEIGLIPPAEYEDKYYRHNPAPTTVGSSVQSLH